MIFFLLTPIKKQTDYAILANEQTKQIFSLFPPPILSHRGFCLLRPGMQQERKYLTLNNLSILLRLITRCKLSLFPFLCNQEEEEKQTLRMKQEA